MMLTWLPGVLRTAGLRVETAAGWETRTRPGGMQAPRGVLCHHTGGPRVGNMPSLRVVRDGRSDLAGPLAQTLLARDGTWVVVAAGRCNHAGPGQWPGITSGNAHLIGVEAENAGTADDPWPPAQMSAYIRGVAAMLAHIGQTSDRAIGHKEWAPGRKVDPSFDMIRFRADVSAVMGEKPSPFRRQILMRGDKGDRVREVQRLLAVNLPVDGVFGPATEAAVMAFQELHGLVVDGVVGPATWAALLG